MNKSPKANSRQYHYYKAGRVAALQRRSLSKRSAATRPAKLLIFCDRWITPYVLPLLFLILAFFAGMIYADISWIDILNNADLETICAPN